MSNDKTEALSFLNPNAVDPGPADPMIDLTYDNQSRTINYQNKQGPQQTAMQPPVLDNLIDAQLVDGELILLTDTDSIVVGNVLWQDDYTFPVSGTSGLLTPTGFVPLTSQDGIVINETAEALDVDYVGDNISGIYAYGLATHPLTPPTLPSSTQVILTAQTPTARLPIPFSQITSSEGWQLGPNGGVVLPRGTYYVDVNVTCMRTFRYQLALVDTSGNEYLVNSGGYTWGDASVSASLQAPFGGLFSVESEREIILTYYLNGRNTSNSQIGYTARITAAWPTTASGVNMAIFRVSNEAEVNPMPRITRKLNDIVTANDTADYLITASTFYSTNHQPFNAFTNSGTIWATAAGNLTGWLNIFIKGSAITANACMVMNRNDDYNVTNESFTLEYKPDELSDWITIVTDFPGPPPVIAACAIIPFNETLTIKEFRLTVTSLAALPAINRIQLVDLVQPTVI